MNTQLKEIAKVWPDIQNTFSVPHNEKDYKKLLNLLDSLIGILGTQCLIIHQSKDKGLKPIRLSSVHFKK